MFSKTKATSALASLIFGLTSFSSLANAPYELMGNTTATGEKASFVAKQNGISLPVTVINGSKEGPVLLLTAGVHGDEYPSMFALQKLQKEIDPSRLSGVLVVLHLANVDGFHSRLIALNPRDHKNLNRAFPGSASGTETEQIAHILTKEFINKSDYLVDMHSGSANQSLLNHVYSPFVGDEKLDALTLDLAKATGMRHIVLYGDRPRDPENSISYPNTAMTRGKPGLTTEIGHLGMSDEASIDEAFDVAQNIMRFLKMLPGKERAHAKPVMYDAVVSTKSPADGFFTSTVKVGNFIAQGQKVGVITDYFGNQVEEVIASESGRVMMVNATPPIRVGESVVSIGVISRKETD